MDEATYGCVQNIVVYDFENTFEDYGMAER
jgi:hypothetical protein